MKLKDMFKKHPQLETKRLILREIKIADAKDIFIFYSDEEVMNLYERSTHKTIKDTNKLIKRFAKNHKERKAILWGITTKDSNLIIGVCGFNRWRPNRFVAQITFIVSKEYWNKGISKEALDAVVQYGFEKMGLNRIEGMSLPENIPSIKLFKKLGFQEEGILREYAFFRGQFRDFKMFSLLKKDFIK